MTTTQVRKPKEVLEIEDFDNPGCYIDRTPWLKPNSFSIGVDPIDTTTFGSNGWTSGISGEITVTIDISGASASELRSFIYTAPSQPFGVRYYPEGKVSGSERCSFNAIPLGNGSIIMSSGGVNSEIMP